MDNSNETEELLILRDLLRALRNMEKGKPFDLTDSPESYTANARRLTAEAQMAIDMLRVAA